VDYIKSIIMTSAEYVHAMEVKAARKEAVEHQKEQRLEEVVYTRGKRAEEKKASPDAKG
jgi:hypothetical protein